MSQANHTRHASSSSVGGIAVLPSVYKTAAVDLIEGARSWRIWTVMAWHGLRQRYRRSWLGLAWITLSFALLIGVKMFIFGALSTKDISFFAPYLATGYLVFRLVSNFIIQGAFVFIAAQSWIKAEPLPLSVHLYKLLASTFIQFAYMAIPALIVCIYTNHFHAMVLLYLPLILLVYAINGVWVSAIMGVLCARHRDIRYFVANIMMVLYFMTPILWVPPATGMRAVVANMNPLTHYVEVLRTPLISGTIPWNSMAVVGVCTLFGLVTSFLVFARTRKNVIFWL
ncbi:MAG: ABC transporter permease [bacterium]|nr:ABC transporter permease [bacterium]